MVRLLIRTAVFLGAAALGLIAAALLLDDVSVSASGFIIVVILYALVQNIIAPFIARVAAKNAPAFLGGVGLLATLVGLVVASVVGNALTVNGGIGTWLSATVIVWFVSAAATLVLPWLLIRAGVEKARDR